MTTLFNLGSVGEGLPHAENTGLVISDTANIRTISFSARVFSDFFDENVADSRKHCIFAPCNRTHSKSLGREVM